MMTLLEMIKSIVSRQTLQMITNNNSLTLIFRTCRTRWHSWKHKADKKSLLRAPWTWTETTNNCTNSTRQHSKYQVIKQTKLSSPFTKKSTNSTQWNHTKTKKKHCQIYRKIWENCKIKLKNLLKSLWNKMKKRMKKGKRRIKNDNRYWLMLNNYRKHSIKNQTSKNQKSWEGSLNMLSKMVKSLMIKCKK